MSYGRESANGNFPCVKLENAKKNLPQIFLAIMKKIELILINMFSPTFVSNLVTLAWTRPTLERR